MKMEDLKMENSFIDKMQKMTKTEEISLVFGNILEVRNVVKIGQNIISETVKHQKVDKDNKVFDITENEFLQEKSINLELEIEEKQKELYKIKELLSEKKEEKK